MLKQRRNLLRSTLALLCAGLMNFAVAAGPAPVQGQDYTLLEPAQPVDNPGKIEVLEFFSYGCPHCNEFSPFVARWEAKLAKDVEFKRVPVSFSRAQWFNLGKLYYALEASGYLTKLDGAVFNAIHEQHQNIYDDKSIIEWAGKQPGVDGKKFADNYNSFSTAARMKRAEQLTAAYKIDGVPKIIVQGKYAVAGNDFNTVLANTNKLIDKVREELNKAPAKKK